MATAPFKIDYSARDFDSIYRAMQDVIRARAPESWNSFAAGDLGTILLELQAYNSDQLSFLLDSQAQESFIGTLRQRESLMHFCRLTGYNVRRNVAASVAVYARVQTPPTQQEVAFVVPQGASVSSNDGQRWEVAREYTIAPGNYTPVTVEQQFGSIIGSVVSDDNVVTSEPAYIFVAPGSTVAYLCRLNGDRFSSEVNFERLVTRGSVLVLKDRYNSSTDTFIEPPAVSTAEYAVIDIGQLEGDVEDGSVLYLDRPWSGTEAFIGKWIVENRNIMLTQGDSRVDTVIVPTDVERRSYSIDLSFFPVLATATSAVVPSGFFAAGGTIAPNDIGVSVSVDGQPWYPTSSLLFEGPNSNAFEYSFDSYDRMSIRFGDGLFGSLLPEQANITISYRTGGGSVGNVVQNMFDTTVAGYLYGQPLSAVTVQLANPFTLGTGGLDRESVADAKRNIPIHVRSNDRAVTPEDYQFLASQFSDPNAGAVALAKGVLHRNTVPREQNIIWVYTWSKGGNGQLVPPTNDLKGALFQYLNDRKMITDEVIIVDGLNTVVPVHMRYKFNAAYAASSVLEKVRSAVNGVFVAQRPGQKLCLSDLYEAVSALAEVECINFYGPMGDLIAKNDFELFYNSIQVGSRFKLASRAYTGTTTVTLEDAASFSPGSTLSLYEAGKLASTSVVEAVDGNEVTLRHPLKSSYTLLADVIDTDFLLDQWCYEKPVNVYVRFLAEENLDALSKAVYRAINRYFRITLKPQGTLYRSELYSIIAAIQDVFNVRVFLGNPDSEIEQLTAGVNELITPGVISINNVVTKPIPEL